MKVVLLAIFLTTLAITGCSSNQDREVRGSANQMYSQAQGYMQSGNFTQAAQVLRNMNTRYPFGAHANQVQLDLIYVYYQVSDQDRALTTIDRFLRLNPNHADADYARYMRGLVHLQLEGNMLQQLAGIDRSDRDPGYAEQAFNDFRELLQRHPESQYAADAQARMLGIKSRLARHELAIAEYYLRREAYMAAANRGRYILESFPSTPEVKRGLEIMVEAYSALELDNLRDDAQQVLALNFPE
ncbi:outer membrane protein assembly factor BamD [Aliidiomarina minuta]|uniref:Outer membrane protein assembly factor BamD n=1 Tax=Aliidiomarina minuta TaxID=880057 RepID=A0A432W4U0_9GAMM|nr:outer membrane protein assembly factor BamD [Aliidiomarina minuta]RUO24521.1 outer membrane protein assembly factor BamD [Aliidiomarina minuta]